MLVLPVTMEVDRLARFVGRPGADRRRPAGDRLRARVLEHRLIRALGEARRVVDRGHRDRERLRRRSCRRRRSRCRRCRELTVTVAVPMAFGAGV